MVPNGLKTLSVRPKEAAKMLGVSTRYLWALTAPRGPIPCVRLRKGKRVVVLYLIETLERWLRMQEAEETRR